MRNDQNVGVDGLDWMGDTPLTVMSTKAPIKLGLKIAKRDEIS